MTSQHPKPKLKKKTQILVSNNMLNFVVLVVAVSFFFCRLFVSFVVCWGPLRQAGLCLVGVFCFGSLSSRIYN